MNETTAEGAACSNRRKAALAGLVTVAWDLRLRASSDTVRGALRKAGIDARWLGTRAAGERLDVELWIPAADATRVPAAIQALQVERLPLTSRTHAAALRANESDAEWRRSRARQFARQDIDAFLYGLDGRHCRWRLDGSESSYWRCPEGLSDRWSFALALAEAGWTVEDLAADPVRAVIEFYDDPSEVLGSRTTRRGAGS